MAERAGIVFSQLFTGLPTIKKKHLRTICYTPQDRVLKLVYAPGAYVAADRVGGKAWEKARAATNGDAELQEAEDNEDSSEEHTEAEIELAEGRHTEESDGAEDVVFQGVEESGGGGGGKESDCEEGDEGDEKEAKLPQRPVRHYMTEHELKNKYKDTGLNNIIVIGVDAGNRGAYVREKAGEVLMLRLSHTLHADFNFSISSRWRISADLVRSAPPYPFATQTSQLTPLVPGIDLR